MRTVQAYVFGSSSIEEIMEMYDVPFTDAETLKDTLEEIAVTVDLDTGTIMSINGEEVSISVL